MIKQMGGYLLIGTMVMVLGTACGAGNPSGSSVTGNGLTVTNAGWALVQADPAKYVGATVRVTGQFAEVVPNSSPVIAQVYLDPQDTSEPVAVQISGSVSLPANAYVAIAGVLTGTQTFQTALGAQETVPVIRAQRVTVITRDAAVDPTLAVTPAVPPQSQNGLTLAVTRVELAAHAVRIFLAATNHSGAGVTISDDSATLTQGTAQLNEKLFSPDVQFFPITLANGVMARAEIVFQAANLQGAPLTLDIPVSSDNYNQTWNDFVFTIPLKPGSAPSPVSQSGSRPNAGGSASGSSSSQGATPSVSTSPSVSATPSQWTLPSSLQVGSANFLTPPVLPSGATSVNYTVRDITMPQDSLTGTFGDAVLGLSADGRGWLLQLPMDFSGSQIQIVLTVQLANGSQDTITSTAAMVQ